MLNVHRTAVAFKSASNKRVQHLQGVPRGDQIGERMQVPANARQYQERRLSCTLSLSLSLSLSPSLSLSLCPRHRIFFEDPSRTADAVHCEG